MGFKASETLLGIETAYGLILQEATEGFKASETLLGIETADDNGAMERLRAMDSKPLKPF